MRLEKLQVVLAPRPYWQAIDLGMRVARQHYLNMLTISFIMMFMISLVSLAIIQDPIWAAVLIWWFKPIMERPLLFYISRAIFGETPPLKITLKSLKNLLKHQWLSTFTIRRLSPNRGFNDAVAVLEGLDGPQRSTRLNTLHSRTTGSTALTIIGLHFESLLIITLFYLPFIFMPDVLRTFSLSDIIEWEETWTDWYWLIIDVLIFSLAAPFYMCCSFILYLNRRTQLEAWDTELGFKKMAQRLSLSKASEPNNKTRAQSKPEPQKHSNTQNKLSVILPVTMAGWCTSLLSGAVLVASLTTGLPAIANDTNEADDLLTEQETAKQMEDMEKRFPLAQNPEAIRVRQALNDLLNSDTFGPTIEEKDYSLDFNWDWDWTPKQEEDSNPLNFGDIPALLALFSGVKYIMILLLAALLVFVIYKYRVWELFGLIIPDPKPEKPKEILGMDVTETSLPKDLFSDIESHIEHQRYREALSLMFRGHLIIAIHDHSIPFKNSNTELECVSILSQHRPQDEVHCFNELTQQWQLLAYAHRPPNGPFIQQLFQQWKPFVREYVTRSPASNMSKAL